MLRLRTATADDAETAYALLAARSRANPGIDGTSLDLVRQELSLGGSDHWLALNASDAVGIATLTSAQEVKLAAVEVDAGSELLTELERRAATRRFDHLEWIVATADTIAWSLAEQGRYAHEKDVLRMYRELDDDLPEPRWPDGALVRTYDDTDAERVHALLDACYGGWGADYVARPHADWLAFMTGHDAFDPSLWFLVEREGRLVGCALHWREHRREGWVKDIVVAPEERGRGLGRALLYEGFRAYAERGVRRVGLKVDSTNPSGALPLYERTGFKTDRTYGMWIKRL